MIKSVSFCISKFFEVVNVTNTYLSLNRNTFDEQGMYFVSGMPTKIDSWGRYGSPYSPHHIWSEEPEGGRARDGFDDFNITREPNSTFDNIFSNQCHIVNSLSRQTLFYQLYAYRITMEIH